MSTILGMVTFGNDKFTRLAIESIRTTTVEHSIDFIVVVGKPWDENTIEYLQKEQIPYIVHKRNFGFPKSLNDIYDYVWKEHQYDNLIIAGNDIVAYPGTIDALISLAESSDYAVISAVELSVKKLVRRFPKAGEFFSGEKYIFTDFSKKPWEAFVPRQSDPRIFDMRLSDIQNLCLYKRAAFDTVGYTDVAFYPAYFVDNDYANRLAMSKIKTCTLNVRFFHFWSRTIHQGFGGSTKLYFENNRKYYEEKWGGLVGEETKNPPIKIDSREEEESIINYWRSA